MNLTIFMAVRKYKKFTLLYFSKIFRPQYVSTEVDYEEMSIFDFVLYTSDRQNQINLLLLLIYAYI